MITNFEEFTHELTEYEAEVLMPIIIKGLSTKIGKARAITSDQIVEALSNKGYKISGARVRKLVHNIRMEGSIERLMATSKGYYISNDPEELETYITSLHQRISSIQAIADQFYFQLNKWRNEVGKV